jgi:Flp pilus assembly protein TadD
VINRAVFAALAAVVLAWSRAPAQIVRDSREHIDTLRLRSLRDSCDPTVHYALGVALFSRNQYDAADSAFRRAVFIDPQFAEAWLALGIIHTQNHDHWNAIKRLGPAAVDREREERRGFVRKAFLVDPFLDIRLLFTGATEGYDGMYRYYQVLEAVATARRGSLDSVSPSILWMHALAAARTIRYQQSIRDVETLLRVSQAIEQNDSIRAVPLRTNEFRYMLAALNQRNGNGAEAARLYEDVLANDLSNYMAHAQLARMYEADSNLASAVRERRAAVDANPDDHTLLTELAITQGFADQWRDAEETLLQARASGACDARVLYRLGIVQQHLGKNAEARASFQTYLTIAPRGQATPTEDARRRLTQLP